MYKWQQVTLSIREAFLKNQWQQVLSLYQEMNHSGIIKDPSLFPPILTSSANLPSLKQGTSVHAVVIKHAFESNTSIINSIMSFYTKCRKTASALTLFDSLLNKDSVSWNVMIHGYLKHGSSEEGLDLFMQARFAGFEPNISTLVLVIQACCNLGATQRGMKIHGLVIRSGFSEIISVRNTLLDLYVKSQCIEFARQLFDEMPERDNISWTVMIAGYAQSGKAEAALRMFRDIRFSSSVIYPDAVTVTSVLRACAAVADINQARAVHGYVIRLGIELDLFVGNSLIDLYSKCSDINASHQVFDKMPERNIVSWNSIISGLISNKLYSEAMMLFGLMEKAGIRADEITVVNLLQSLKNLGDRGGCKCIHSVVIRRGFEGSELVLNSLVDAYAKCETIELAHRLFERIEQTDLVLWSTMIAGFAKCGKPYEAIALFNEMHTVIREKPNRVTMLGILEACSKAADMRRARWAHGMVLRGGFGMEVDVGTELVDMYAKCGDVTLARKVFDEMPERNIMSWSAIIAAYGMNGRAHDALALFHEMKLNQEIKPNNVTILSVLTACSHGGLVEEGKLFFSEMVREHGVVPCLEHYACVVDMLGRAGELGSAVEVIRKMPQGVANGASIWGALLSACRNHGNIELGEGVADRLLEVEPSNAAGYMLASGMYAAAGLWEDAARMRCLVRKGGLRVVSGYSLIETNHKIHKFVAGDKSHLQSSHIYETIGHLLGNMKREEAISISISVA